MGLSRYGVESNIGITYDHDGHEGIPGVVSGFQLLRSLDPHDGRD